MHGKAIGPYIIYEQLMQTSEALQVIIGGGGGHSRACKTQEGPAAYFPGLFFILFSKAMKRYFLHFEWGYLRVISTKKLLRSQTVTHHEFHHCI